MEILVLVGTTLFMLMFPIHILRAAVRERHTSLEERLAEEESRFRSYGEYVDDRKRLERLLRQAKSLLQKCPRHWLLDEVESKLNIVGAGIDKVVPTLRNLGKGSV